MKADILTRKPGDRPNSDIDKRQKYQFQTLIRSDQIYPDLLVQLENTAKVEEVESVTLAPLLEGDADEEELLEFLEDRVRAAQPKDATYQRIAKKLEDRDYKDQEFTLVDYEIKDGALLI